MVLGQDWGPPKIECFAVLPNMTKTKGSQGYLWPKTPELLNRYAVTCSPWWPWSSHGQLVNSDTPSFSWPNLGKNGWKHEPKDLGPAHGIVSWHPAARSSHRKLRPWRGSYCQLPRCESGQKCPSWLFDELSEPIGGYGKCLLVVICDPLWEQWESSVDPFFFVNGQDFEQAYILLHGTFCIARSW